MWTGEPLSPLRNFNTKLFGQNFKNDELFHAQIFFWKKDLRHDKIILWMKALISGAGVWVFYLFIICACVKRHQRTKNPLDWGFNLVLWFVNKSAWRLRQKKIINLCSVLNYIFFQNLLLYTNLVKHTYRPNFILIKKYIRRMKGVRALVGRL